MSQRSRSLGNIKFAQSPFPDGHRIIQCDLSLTLYDDRSVLHAHVVTENYPRDHADGDESDDSWRSKSVWANYGRCTLSSTMWKHSGAKLPPIADADELESRIFTIDKTPANESMKNSFGLYLLGHDGCGHHRITFEKRLAKYTYRVRWTGRIALLYVGHTDYKHRFAMEINRAKIRVVVAKTAGPKSLPKPK